MDMKEKYKAEDFIAKVKKEMKDQNISVQELAKRLGCSRRVVYNWLNGENIPTLGNYLKIKEVLGIE